MTEHAVVDVTVADGVNVTLCVDRVGNEWIIVTSPDYPDYEGEITPSDDPPLFYMFKRMIEDTYA